MTEGPTDRLVLEGLVTCWLGEEDFIARHIQPPESALAEGLDENLSDGWKGVVAWCQGKRPAGPAGRDEALAKADCLFVHVDADVATDSGFAMPPFSDVEAPVSDVTDWIRARLIEYLGGILPKNIVFCIPSKDLEAWILCALHPEVADEYAPIELKEAPGVLLCQRAPFRLIRRKDGRYRKVTDNYQKSVGAIVKGWPNVTSGEVPRCPEALRFEIDARRVLVG